MAWKPDWTTDGADWPNRDASRFVEAGGVRWHVQVAGAGPTLLMLHGTGAATHSFRDLFPLLTPQFRVIAPDLPGHGFSSTPGPRGLSLPGVAASVGTLLRTLDAAPALIFGHSAGAAIAIRMALDGAARPGAIISVNGALEPFPGVAGFLFPQMARLLFFSPLAAQGFAWRARQTDGVARLIRSTGSTIDERGSALYARLLGTPGHIDGALGLMAHWDLAGLQADLPKLKPRLVLIAAENDRAVPPASAETAAARAPDAVAMRWPGLGHLAHEEDPARAAALIAATLS